MAIYARGFFIFLFFIFRFLQKYIFDLENYRSIPRPPSCRAAGTWPPGSRAAGAYPQKKEKQKLQTDPWGLAARQRGGRPPPLYKVLAAPHPLICLTKNLKKSKEREGGREGVRERQSGEALSSFQADDFS